MDGYSGSRLLNDYSSLKILGSGSFGVVFDAKHTLDKTRYAVKITFLSDDRPLREVENLAKLPLHNNIVQYRTSWRERMRVGEVKEIMGIECANFSIPAGLESLDLLCIKMELCSENLRNWLGRQVEVPKAVLYRMSLQLAKGVQHIHSSGLIHRDLKPENIFLSLDKSTLKIGDLGISTISRRGSNILSRTKGSGTPMYLAPEQETNQYEKEVDIHALGLIVFELSSPDLQPGRNAGNVQKLLSTLSLLKRRGKFPEGFEERWSSNLKEMIEKMIEYDVKSRASIQDVIDFFLTNLIFFICNGCGEKEIRGIRYKCSVCKEFNLCEKCESRVGIHDEKHPFLKLRGPMGMENIENSSQVISPQERKNEKVGIKVTTSAEFENALANCAPGDRIELGEGEFIGNYFFLTTDNVQIVGKGEKTIIRIAEDEFKPQIVFGLTGSYCEIRDLHLLGKEDDTCFHASGNYNKIENIVVTGKQSYYGFCILKSNFNTIKNCVANGFKHGVSIDGNDNLLETTSLGCTVGSNEICLVIIGHRNKISNVSINDDAKFSVSGKENEITHCESTSDFFITDVSALCRVEGGLFKTLAIQGANNKVDNVVVKNTLWVEGCGHSIERCRAPKFATCGNKDLITLKDNSFETVFER